MACENAIMGTDILKKAMIETGIMTEEEMDQVAVFPNTAVDRMVFDGHHHGKDGICGSANPSCTVLYPFTNPK